MKNNNEKKKPGKDSQKSSNNNNLQSFLSSLIAKSAIISVYPIES